MVQCCMIHSHFQELDIPSLHNNPEQAVICILLLFYLYLDRYINIDQALSLH